jgi:hypothetical protein
MPDEEEPKKTPTEPSADIRQAASAMWQMYVALTGEGFSESQALTIVGYALRGNTDSS